MTNPRICSECDNLLVNRAAQAKTCSDTCRGKRSRRLRKENADREAERREPTEIQQAAQIARGDKDDIARQVVRDALRPIVKGAITQDVLRGIQDLVALTPEVVAAVTEDLRSEDPVVRQRAYGMVMKYTLGNPAVAPTDENDGQRLEVNFNLPRPDSGDEPPALVTAEDVEATELSDRECDMCGNSYPEDKFVDGSDRCIHCWEKQRAEVAERYGD